jgi:fosfomycin resistance protein FosX
VIQGLSHLTFIVRDLDKMARIITEVLGGEEVYSSGDKSFSTAREKFFVAGGVWIAIMEGESLPSRSYNHVAFKVTDQQLETARLAVERLGLDVKPPRARVEGEGQSLYFYDHDNHLFELHTGTLDERLARYGVAQGPSRTPLSITYMLTDADLGQLVAHSKSRLFGLSGKTIGKLVMAYSALLVLGLAFAMPQVMGMADDDPGRVPLQLGILVAGAILVCLYPAFSRWYTRQSSSAYQTLPLQLKLRIDDTGVHSELVNQTGFTTWASVERTVETDNHFLIYLNRLRGYVIPKTALTNATDQVALRQLISTHVKPDKT